MIQLLVCIGVFLAHYLAGMPAKPALFFLVLNLSAGLALSHGLNVIRKRVREHRVRV